MSPQSTITSAVVALGWLVSRMEIRETRRQARIILKILRRFTLYDYERSDEADNLASALDEITQTTRRRREPHTWPLSDGAVARQQCLMSHQFRCAISGALLGFNGQVHHIVPLSFGGGWEQENLCYIDPRFHRAIHDTRLMKEDWITELQWEQVLEFRGIIDEAEIRWKKRFSKQARRKELRQVVAA
jgi:5-methylcytosine-specific restriction endonuclease McrA